jgi:hypothetical protein
MKFKKSLIVFSVGIILVLGFVFFLNKINAQDSNSNGSSSDVNSIKKLIQEKTPEFISKPVIAFTDGMETFRNEMSEKTNLKLIEKQQEIQKIKDSELKSSAPVKASVNLTQEKKPEITKSEKFWKYAELTALQIGLFVFGNQFVFYTVIFILVFFLLRFIWLRIF